MKTMEQIVKLEHEKVLRLSLEHSIEGLERQYRRSLREIANHLMWDVTMSLDDKWEHALMESFYELNDLVKNSKDTFRVLGYFKTLLSHLE